jgi:outer membrane protein assembly factor BamD
MERADDAKARLLALHQPVPRPTKAALAQNKAEEASRSDQTIVSRMMGGFEKHPDVAPATKVGDPTLTDPTPVSARDLVQQANRVASGGKGSEALAVTVEKGTPAENAPVPRSDSTPAQPETAAAADDKEQSSPGPDELKPNMPGQDATRTESTDTQDPNELKPNVSADDKPLPAPAQVNEIQTAASPEPAAQAASSTANGQEPADDQEIASSKHKKKKGLHKIIPVR